ncbi:MAG: helix-turn-helix domain-containing protein [Dehalococcoidia bacterium]|nr:helix-turn-helix domain-containing protein [Dehalococcoidia bacterium]
MAPAVTSAPDRKPPGGEARERATAPSGGTRWVNLGRACEILGVNESTVRRWADSGELRCFRTPGGHRRFAEAELYALTDGTRRGEHEIETAAVRRIRRQLSADRDATGWYARLEVDERDALRPLGRRLLELVGDYIAVSKRTQRDGIEAEVDEIGVAYGRLLKQRETPLLQAIQAFTFFRRSLDDTAKQLAERNRLGADEAAKAREDIAGLADRVLVAVTAAYDDTSAPGHG